MEQLNSDYIFDPCFVIRPDGSMHLREISIIPNPEKPNNSEKEETNV